MMERLTECEGLNPLAKVEHGVPTAPDLGGATVTRRGGDTTPYLRKPELQSPVAISAAYSGGGSASGIAR